MVAVDEPTNEESAGEATEDTAREDATTVPIDSYNPIYSHPLVAFFRKINDIADEVRARRAQEAAEGAAADEDTTEA